MSNTILYGRVVRDIEVRYTNQNMAVARFSVAVNRKYQKDNKRADFFNVTAFGKRAETLSQYFRQGSRIVVYCHPQQEQYTKQDGTKVDTVSFILDEFDFVDTMAEGGIMPSQNTKNSVESTHTENDWMSVPDNLDDESLPFN